LIVALILQRKMTVRIPLCDRHRYPWTKLTLLGVFLLFYILVPVVMGVVVSIVARNAWGENSWAPALFIGWLVGLVVLFVMLFQAQRRTIRAKEITPSSIDLSGVSVSFADRLD
jgi:hypothetical protein